MRTLTILCAILTQFSQATLRVGLVSLDAVTPQSYSFQLYLLQYEGNLESVEQWIDEMKLDVVFDLSHSEFASAQISRLSTPYNFVHILSWSETLVERFDAVYPHLTRDYQLAAGEAVLKQLQISELMVLTNDFRIPEKLSIAFDVVAFATVIEDTPQISLDKLVSRVFKSEGVRTLIIDLPAELTEKALISLGRARMMVEGYAFICSPQATWLSKAANYIGPLMIVESGNELAASALDLELLSLEWGLKQSYNNSSCKFNLKSCLKAIYQSKSLKLLNLVGSEMEEVGTLIGEKVFLSKNIRYPGDALYFDPTKPVIIHLSTLSNSKNTAGETDPGNTEAFKGYFVAEQEVLNSNFLGRFKLQSKEIECSSSVSDPQFTYSCLSRMQFDLGIAIIGSYSSRSTITLLDAMKRLNITTPVIGSQSTSSELSSKYTWPNFVRTIKPSITIVPGVTKFLIKFGYTSVNLYYSDEPYGQDFANAMLQSLAFNNIEVVNPTSTRAITDEVVLKPMDFLDIGQKFIDSGIRPAIILSMPEHKTALIDIFWASGVKTEDVNFFFDVQDSCLWANSSSTEVVAKRMAIALYSFSFEQTSFAGPLGEASYKVITEATQTPASSGQCQYFDSCYLLAYALHAMILRGEDYEVHAELDSQLRDTTFYGCTGKVAIDKDSNDRRDQDSDVFNLQKIDGIYQSVLVLTVSPTSIQLASEIAPFIWPGGGSTSPKLNRLNYKNCPFAEEHRHDFEKGKDLVFWLSAFYFAFVAVIAVTIYLMHTLKNSVEMLKEPAQVSFQDRLVLGLVLLDFLQYVGHGPVLQNGSNPIQNLSRYISDGSYGPNVYAEGVYWKILNTVIVVVFLWVLFSIFLWIRSKGIRFRCLEWITDAAEIFIPWLGGALFLPITSVLFDTFICIEAHGPPDHDLDFKDSFLYRDCYQDCWVGPHLKYAFISSIALVIYFPVTVLTRPRWQEIYQDIHVKTRPTFYLQKNLVEVTLVVIHKGVLEKSKLVHGVLFIIVVLLHMTLSIFNKPFNYPRLNLWFYFSMLLVAWGGIISLIEDHFSTFSGAYLAGLFFGLFAVLSKGYFSSRSGTATQAVPEHAHLS